MVKRKIILHEKGKGLDARSKAKRDLLWAIIVLIAALTAAFLIWQIARLNVQLAPEEEGVLMFRCFDSDKGDNLEIKGIASATKEMTNGDVEKISYTDKCADENGLVEYYCGAENIEFRAYVCEKGCKDGVCA